MKIDANMNLYLNVAVQFIFCKEKSLIVVWAGVTFHIQLMSGIQFVYCSQSFSVVIFVYHFLRYECTLSKHYCFIMIFHKYYFNTSSSSSSWPKMEPVLMSAQTSLTKQPPTQFMSCLYLSIRKHLMSYHPFKPSFLAVRSQLVQSTSPLPTPLTLWPS